MGYELVVCDAMVPEFEDIAIDSAIDTAIKSIESTTTEVQVLARDISIAFHRLAFNHKDLNEQLRLAHNELAELRGHQQVTKDVDPVTMCDEKGQRDGVPETNHNANRSQSASSKRRASVKAKELFKKIAARTHPDKTKNKELNAVFLVARDAVLNNDVYTLEQILKDVIEYIKIRKSRHLFRNFKQRLLKNKRQILNAERNKIYQIKATLEYKCYADMGTSREEETYKAFIDLQLRTIHEEIEKIRIFKKVQEDMSKAIFGQASDIARVFQVFTSTI